MDTTYARRLRNNPSKAERLLWLYLKNKQLKCHKFRRQYIIAPFIVDFICLSQRLIIEVDGGHHAEQTLDDARRTRFLEDKGYTVLRFWNNEVLGNTEGVLEVIAQHCE